MKCNYIWILKISNFSLNQLKKEKVLFKNKENEMSQIIVNPNVKNFIQSLRDIGYSFEVAVADIIDNSITAKSSLIKIYTVAEPYLIFSLLDNGYGMEESELIECMRLATKNPLDIREPDDLGRFGLGLKTASFSQCKKLTVISKKYGKISAKQWDLDYISMKNEWFLKSIDNYNNIPLFSELINNESGTLIFWEEIDRCEKKNFSNVIDRLRKHLALVFHRYLEGADRTKLKIVINENPITAFNPFNLHHPATQQTVLEKIMIYDSVINVQPYILPHHSKVSQKEYELYATEEGYIKSQGFYLYRGNRILIYGTWWGLHKTLDAHKLVRIKIDIPNNMDTHWGIDIKKSIARPSEKIRTDLKRIIDQVTEKGSRPFTGRGRKIEDKTILQFWEILPNSNEFRFGINQEHPLFRNLKNELSSEVFEKLNIYLKGLQAYLPLEAIQHNLQKNPHLIKQKDALSETDIANLTERLLNQGLSDEYIEELLKTEIYINRSNPFSQ